MSDVSTALRAVEDVLRTANLLTEVRGSEDIFVRGVSQDSRTVAADDLFLAWTGVDSDAHDYVSNAVADGAIAAVVERPVDVDVPQLVVRDGRRAAAIAADVVLGSPSAEMTLVGITGTNGKTTTSQLVQHLVEDYPRDIVTRYKRLVEGGVDPNQVVVRHVDAQLNRATIPPCRRTAPGDTGLTAIVKK